MELVVMSQEGYTDICDEARQWKLALRYSIKANESKEYRTYLLQSLFLFLDRLCLWDAERSKAGVETGLPVFKSFAIDFLLKDIFLQKAGYPGVVADKEPFCAAILDCILTFSLQDQRFGDSNIFARNSVIFIRKRSKEESTAMDDVLRAVVNENVFSSLLALVHSVWNPTRTAAFNSLVNLAVCSKSKGLTLPEVFMGEAERKFIYARGIHLASSPRQRESDTGSRILAFLYTTWTNPHEKRRLLASLSDLSTLRMTTMKNLLYPSGFVLYKSGLTSLLDNAFASYLDQNLKPSPTMQ